MVLNFVARKHKYFSLRLGADIKWIAPSSINVVGAESGHSPGLNLHDLEIVFRVVQQSQRSQSSKRVSWERRGQRTEPLVATDKMSQLTTTRRV